MLQESQELLCGDVQDSGLLILFSKKQMKITMKKISMQHSSSLIKKSYQHSECTEIPNEHDLPIANFYYRWCWQHTPSISKVAQHFSLNYSIFSAFVKGSVVGIAKSSPSGYLDPATSGVSVSYPLVSLSMFWCYNGRRRLPLGGRDVLFQFLGLCLG